MSFALARVTAIVKRFFSLFGLQLIHKYSTNESIRFLLGSKKSLPTKIWLEGFNLLFEKD